MLLPRNQTGLTGSPDVVIDRARTYDVDTPIRATPYHAAPCTTRARGEPARSAAQSTGHRPPERPRRPYVREVAPHPGHAARKYDRQVARRTGARPSQVSVAASVAGVDRRCRSPVSIAPGCPERSVVVLRYREEVVIVVEHEAFVEGDLFVAVVGPQSRRRDALR